jgi:Holliday junction resolvasome RuvABC endonuclease subunit
MNILGLDLASSATGWCWSDGEALRRGCWKLGRSNEHEGRRLERLYEYLHKLHEAWGVDRIGCEESSLGAGGRSEGVQWSTVVVHNQLRGIVALFASQIGAEVRWVNPSSLKKFATGNGRAKKPDMIRAAKVHYGIDTDDDNIADALHVAAYVRLDRPRVAKRKRKTKKSAKPKERLLW